MARRAIFELSSADVQYIAQHLDLQNTFTTAGVFDPAHLPSAEQCEILSTSINSSISDDRLAALPRLKLIATRSTGSDHIDLQLMPQPRHHGIESSGLRGQRRRRAYVYHGFCVSWWSGTSKHPVFAPDAQFL